MIEAQLLKKLDTVKLNLFDRKLKKTGWNKYHKYEYYELEDITEPITQELRNNHLSSFFNQIFEDGYDFLVLTIKDLDTGYKLEFKTRLAPKEPKDMKEVQSRQTYARRALWLMALQIMEPNQIEMTRNTSKKDVKPDIYSKYKYLRDKLMKQGKFTLTDLVEELKKEVEYNTLSDTDASKIIELYNKGE